MGNNQSMQKINYEDVQLACKNPELYILINTLPDTEQNCLIKNTIHAEKEEHVMNKCMQITKNVCIIIYGRNSNDELVYKKYTQIIKLGFSKVYIYPGGLFEWLMLQDIFGVENFPTSSKIMDFLKYKPKQKLNIALLEY